MVSCRPEPDGVYPFETGNVCARNEIWKHMVSCGRKVPDPCLNNSCQRPLRERETRTGELQEDAADPGWLMATE